MTPHVGNRIPRLLKQASTGACCILVPMLFVDSPGTPDLGVFLDWQAAVGEQGAREAYHALIDEYPPLAHVALSLASSLSRVLNLSPFHALKLTLLMAGYASTLVVLMWRPRLVLPITALLTIYGMVYGYLDVLFAAPLLVALWCLERGRAGSAGVAYAIACATKWQPIIIGPFILVHLWMRREWLHLFAFVAGALAVGVSVLAVFGLPVVISLARAVRDPFISGNALNLPWLVTAVLEHMHLWGFNLSGDGTVVNRTVSIAQVPLPELIVVLILKASFVLGYGYTLWCFIASGTKTFRDLVLFGLAGFLGFFVLNTGVHENHLFVPALLGVVLLSFHERPRWVIEGVVVLSVANLFLFFGPRGEGVPYTQSVAFALDALAAVLLSVLYVGLLALIRKPARLWRGCVAAAKPASSSVSELALGDIDGADHEASRIKQPFL